MKKHIVIEGIHGSGKTTIAKYLAEKLAQEGLNAQYYHFPDETDPLGQIIRSTLTERALVKNREVIGLLYAAFSNRFHIRTKSDDITYVQERDSVTTGLVFQSDIPRDTRMQIYSHAIANLQSQGIVIYVRSDIDIARERLQKRNAQLLTQGDVRKDKANDVFVAEEFENLSLRYEKEMLPGLEKMHIPYFIVENNGTIEECLNQIMDKLAATPHQ
jgi:thymidylate kinase